MKLEKYEKLKQNLEVLKLEKNFSALNKTLYWFSFLGNIFLIYFGYFFIKNITDTLPDMFPYQNVFFTIFIALFLTGYELTKRFILEQTATSIIMEKKLSLGIGAGLLISIMMILGSFYLSLNGAHRLVDGSDRITQSIDSTLEKKTVDINKKYDDKIALIKSLKLPRKQFAFKVDSIEVLRQAELDKNEAKTEAKSTTIINKNSQNDTAFLFMTFFLEIIIIVGVGFHSYYVIGSYQETGKLLQTPKYKQFVINIKLLKIYYNNGKKGPGDVAMSMNKLSAMAKSQKISVTPSEIRDFINNCSELQIIEETRNRRKQFTMTYEEAKPLLQKDEIL